MRFDIIRTLRTATSERFILQREPGQDAAALELHYLDRGRVSGTLLLLENSGFGDEDLPALLSQLDEILLPDVSIEEGNLTFTVVRGHVLGTFAADVDRH